MRTKAVVFGKDVRETTFITKRFASVPKFSIKDRYEKLTHSYTFPMGRRDTEASWRHTSFSSDRAFGRQDRSGERDCPQSRPHQDAREEDSGAMAHQLGSEEDIRYPWGRGMKERGPAEGQLGRVGADPVDRVEEGPGVGVELDPSRNPVLDGVGMDQ